MLSVPKSGTHLLIKTLELMTGEKILSLATDPFFEKQHNVFPPLFRINPDEFQTHYPMKPNQCLYGHMNASYFFHTFSSLHPEYVPLIMIRDLRDVLVSMAFFYPFPKEIKKMDHKLLYLMEEIKPTSVWNTPSQAKEAIPWLSNSVVIRFEDLVGKKGGGTFKKQEYEIFKIAHALGIQYDKKLMKRVKDKMWGGTWTFRKGVIGEWRRYFTDKHKKVFKQKMGDILIKLGYEESNDW